MLAAAGPSLAAPKPKAPAKPAAKAAAKPAAKAKLPAGVVATVNGNAIKQSDVSERMWREMGQQEVDREVNKTIVRLEAKKRGITVDKKKIDGEYYTQKQRFITSPGKTAKDWTDFIAHYGEANLRDDLTIQLLATAIGEQEASKTTLTAAEKQTATDTLERDAHQVHAKHILVGVGAQFNNRTDEDAKKRVDEAMAKLNGGAKWDDVAKEYSDDASNKNNGGDLGFFTRGQMVKEFEDAAFALKAGEMTKEPVKTSFGYHIIKVEEVKDTPVTQAAKDKAIADALAQKKEQAKSPSVWFNKVRANYKIVEQMPYEK
jgi:parvulin-like peptidyl-prolyl isomerase